MTSAVDLPGATCADPCSLRQAIGAANAAPGPDNITFAIGSGPVVLAIADPLPVITGPLAIEGDRQPGTEPLPRITLDGSSTPTGTHGLVAQGPIALEIDALEIRHFPGHGVLLDGTVGSSVGGTGALQGSLIHHNGLDGVAITGAAATGNRVLGTRLFDNGGLGIDLGDDGNGGGGGCPVGGPVAGVPNGGQCVTGPDPVGAGPSPQLSASFAAPAGPVRVEFFWSDDCRFDGEFVAQARELIGAVDVDQATIPWGPGSATTNSTRPLSGGFVTATVTSLSGTSDLGPCTMVEVPTDLAISPEPHPAVVVAGQPAELVVNVTNEGPVDHEAALVAIQLSSGSASITAVSASVPAACSVVDGTIGICMGVALDVGSGATVSVTLVPSGAGDLVLDVGVLESLTSVDPDPSDNRASISLTAIEDANGDGIADGLQPGGTPTGSFLDDSIVPPTSGSVVSTGGLDVLILDASDPLEGVRVIVGPGAPGTQVELSVCGGFPVFVDQGSDLTGTCGSVTIAVLTGRATVVLGDGLATVTIPADGSARVVDNGNGTFAVENLGDPLTGPAILITVDGVTSEVGAGDTVTAAAWDFAGFTHPVDNGGVLNVLKAGQAVPLKWRLLDATGAPMTNLTSAVVTVASLACSAGTTPDVLEEVAAGASALQNLGDGYYQLNWKSPKTYAGSCKTLHLDIGDGVLHDALFQFKK